MCENEYEEIARLLAMAKENPPTLEDIYRMMDFVWDEIGCDNKKYDLECSKRFYNHPIWLLNGLFIENDPVSKRHRKVISEHVCKLGEDCQYWNMVVVGRYFGKRNNQAIS
jgi:2-polyprenyl-6-hydroxyphenyl methylase/3-demethylubiquinone-9 3-methyltransferase